MSAAPSESRPSRPKSHPVPNKPPPRPPRPRQSVIATESTNSIHSTSPSNDLSSLSPNVISKREQLVQELISGETDYLALLTVMMEVRALLFSE